jgi:hypothetical protein
MHAHNLTLLLLYHNELPLLLLLLLQILGVMSELADGSLAQPKHILHHIFKHLVRFKMLNQDGPGPTFTANTTSSSSITSTANAQSYTPTATAAPSDGGFRNGCANGSSNGPLKALTSLSDAPRGSGRSNLPRMMSSGMSSFSVAESKGGEEKDNGGSDDVAQKDFKGEFESRGGGEVMTF